MPGTVNEALAGIDGTAFAIVAIVVAQEVELARAYLEAGAFAQADSELDRCYARRGEALALFLDEEPTFGITPLLDYTQGRVREGLGTTGFVDSYRRYVDLKGPAGEDALLGEVRRRIAAATSRAGSH